MGTVAKYPPVPLFGEFDLVPKVAKPKTLFDGRGPDSKEEWLTPPDLLHALGEFELDPCAPVNRPWDMARQHFTLEHDGLKQDWQGRATRVFCNPPYVQAESPCQRNCKKQKCVRRGFHVDRAIPGTDTWVRRSAEHGNAIVLIFARTETGTFFPYVWDMADAIYFIKGRIAFYNVDGTRGEFNGGAPSCLVAYGEQNVKVLESGALKRAGYDGKLIRL